MSYLARMMYMQNMDRYIYSVQRGTVQRASLEDSTEELRTD